MELALLGSNVSKEVLSAIICVYSFSHLNKELPSKSAFFTFFSVPGDILCIKSHCMP